MTNGQGYHMVKILKFLFFFYRNITKNFMKKGKTTKNLYFYRQGGSGITAQNQGDGNKDICKEIIYEYMMQSPHRLFVKSKDRVSNDILFGKEVKS